jgi:hypothetical protein
VVGNQPLDALIIGIGQRPMLRKSMYDCCHN